VEERKLKAKQARSEKRKAIFVPRPKLKVMAKEEPQEFVGPKRPFISMDSSGLDERLMNWLAYHDTSFERGLSAYQEVYRKSKNTTLKTDTEEFNFDLNGPDAEEPQELSKELLYRIVPDSIFGDVLEIYALTSNRELESTIATYAHVDESKKAVKVNLIEEHLKRISVDLTHATVQLLKARRKVPEAIIRRASELVKSKLTLAVLFGLIFLLPAAPAVAAGTASSLKSIDTWVPFIVGGSLLYAAWLLYETFRTTGLFKNVDWTRLGLSVFLTSPLVILFVGYPLTFSRWVLWAPLLIEVASWFISYVITSMLFRKYPLEKVQQQVDRLFEHIKDRAFTENDRILMRAFKHTKGGVKVLVPGLPSFWKVLCSGKSSDTGTIMSVKEFSLPWHPWKQVTAYLIIRRALGLEFDQRMKKFQITGSLAKLFVHCQWAVHANFEIIRRLHYYPLLLPYLLVDSFIRNIGAVYIALIYFVVEPPVSGPPGGPMRLFRTIYFPIEISEGIDGPGKIQAVQSPSVVHAGK
jgi:hypothetical protein